MKAARGCFFALGVQLLLAASATTSSSAGADGIPAVGIGAVHPLCDPLQEECISSDEQVQDGIISGLQADDKVTDTSNAIELGELLCDTLDEAPGSTKLRFTISSEETVAAERTSYSEFDGSAFSDGLPRKIWKGIVVDPVPAADDQRTISMTWTSPCETETFVLKMTTRHVDNTISITTSVPCDAGSSTDICMVQYDVDLPPPVDPVETTTDSTRRLAERAGEPIRESAPVTSRNLQSTVQIDVMFVYDEAALERGFVVTPEQMETLIADELPFSNEAADNSLIDLRFNLVHAGPLPYTVQTQDDNIELFNLRVNNDVKALRNQYQADLVVLVGVFPAVCGRAYINPDTDANDEQFGYGLIDVNCFDGRTTSHEIGHNMGADHDRANTALAETDYGHGLRYCAEDADVRYRTLMAYPCSYNTQRDEAGWSATWINFFSNPDVDYLDSPTGTSEENNAQILRDNMVAVSNFRNTAGDQMCTAGVPGILSGDACCPISCGACGGSGCSSRDGGDDFTGGEACCTVALKGLGRVCSASVGAPCVVSDDQTCGAGIPGILSGETCCPTSCGSCGGSGCGGRDGGDEYTGSEACCNGGVRGLGRVCSANVGAPCVLSDDGSGCSSRDGGDDFTGGEACCEGGVKDLGRICSSNVGAPCILSDDQTCAAGISGILSGDTCCPNSCGACGGSGCSGRDGGDDFTGGEACCTSGVKDLGRICSSTVGAPCVFSDEEEMCSADVPGILADEVCCPSSCGSCGGTGCSGRDGGNNFTGSEACCKGGVRELGRVCSSSVGAPCVFSETEPETETCTAGVPGILADEVCCPSSCGSCGGTGCSGRDGGSSFTGSEACCKGGVRELGRVCSSSVGAPCVVEGDGDDDGSDDGEFTCDGVQKGDFCCSDGCGECGGSGCSNRGGGLTGDDCCTKNISESGRVCSSTRSAPCYFE
eukprot:g8986.t1